MRLQVFYMNSSESLKTEEKKLEEHVKHVNWKFL